MHVKLIIFLRSGNQIHLYVTGEWFRENRSKIDELTVASADVVELQGYVKAAKIAASGAWQVWKAAVVRIRSIDISAVEMVNDPQAIVPEECICEDIPAGSVDHSPCGMSLHREG